MSGFGVGDLVRLDYSRAAPADEVFMVSTINHDSPETYELTNQGGNAVLGSFEEGDMIAVNLWDDDYHVRKREEVIDLIITLIKYIYSGCTGNIGRVIWI